MNILKSFSVICSISLFALLFPNSSFAQCEASKAHVNGRLSGDFVKAVFKVQEKIEGVQYCSGIKATSIDSFSVLILRGEKPIFMGRNIGSGFRTEIINQFQSIRTDDIVIFYSIRGTNAEGKSEKLNPVEYRIVD